jgi:hypothetical protein
VIHLTKLAWTLGIAPVFFIHKPSTFGPLFINSSSFSNPTKPGPAHKHFILHAPRTMGPYFVNGPFDIATISVPHCAREVLSNLRKNNSRHPAKQLICDLIFMNRRNNCRNFHKSYTCLLYLMAIPGYLNFHRNDEPWFSLLLNVQLFGVRYK